MGEAIRIAPAKRANPPFSSSQMTDSSLPPPTTGRRLASSSDGFPDPRAALANLHPLTPEPADALLLTPLLPRLLQALSEAPDPEL
jgi:hypothetical protein